MYHITFQQIHYFINLAQTLNFTESSEMLYISQPTLSKQITALEEELGFPLFERTKRSVALTPEGKLLSKEWQKIENSLNTSIYNAKSLNLKKTGTLRIGLADTFEIDDELAPIIESFSDKYPDIDIDIESLGLKALRKQLYSNDLDIIFIPQFELLAFNNIEKFRFQDVELAIAVPISNPLSQKEHVTVSDLEGEPFVALSTKESSLGMGKSVDYMRKYGIEPNIVKQVSNLNSLTLAVRNGRGVTICHSKINNPGIKIYSLDSQPDDCHIYAVWKSDSPSVETELFKDLLEIRISDKV